ncbi:MAG: excinuclease ABC subunit UvrC [Bacteroidota bacterium]
MKKAHLHKEKLESIIANLPAKPGVYQYYDENEHIIYVGKAKNLKKRVASYFNKEKHESGKINILVRKIANIRFIVVDTEFDALLLENNLIKKFQPRYNILLKDDKTYPWICIKNETFPRIFPTRNFHKDGSQYFGPYASVRMMNTLLELIRQVFQIRNCKLNLSRENILQNKFKICLEYHIKNCAGPCVNLQTEEDYRDTINRVVNILKGNINQVIVQLEILMKEHAAALEFEKANMVKEKIELLRSYQSKSTIVSPSINNVDVFSIISEAPYAFVNYLKVINGAIVQAHTVEVKFLLDETPEEILSNLIVELRERFQSNAPEIIVPIKPKPSIPDIIISIPQRGDKLKLLSLSEQNCKYFKLDHLKQKELVDPERHSKRILQQLMTDLHMKELPAHIECFDNSNIQGTNAVAAMVVFKNAKPFKKDYRHYNIKTVEGPDDYASMEEIIYRRYKRLLEESLPLPNLIVIDGGKGQLHAALNSLEKLELRGKISIISIAKRLEEIYFPDDSIPMYLDKKSESLKIIQQLRDEAHRFGITHHRNRREKSTLITSLTDINGIGPETSQALLRKFKSVKKISALTLQELEKEIGKAKAKTVYAHFEKTK